MLMKRVLTALAGASFLLPMATVLSASEITLTLPDHSITIVGQFGGMDDDAYIVITDFAVITVPCDLVICEGADCVADKPAPSIQG